MTNICELPEDVLIEILERSLPLEIRPRLRCVSKSWKTLINMRHSTALIVLTNNNRLRMSECLDSSPESTKLNLTDINLKPHINYSEIELIGLCYGLVCLLLDNSKVVVLNPCTKEVVEVPPCSPAGENYTASLGFGYNRRNYNYLSSFGYDGRNDYTSSLGFGYNGRDNYTLSFGFGYNDVEGDYKVVRLVWYEESSKCQVKVYSLKLKRWRDIDIEADLGIGSLIRYAGVFANGAVHWCMSWKECYGIVAFDLATEKLLKISIPAEAYHHVHSFGKVAGCLSLIHQHMSFDDIECFDFWTMKEYGKQDSWTRLRLRHRGRMRYYEEENLLSCNFVARTVNQVKPSIGFLEFRSENEEDDLMLWDVDPVGWKGVYKITFQSP